MRVLNILLFLILLVLASHATIYGLGEWNKKGAKVELDSCISAAEAEYLYPG